MIPKYVIIHHSLTKDSGTVSWDAIRKYHTKTLGWNAIGYHWGIELVNKHYEIIAGRISDRVGAHVIGMNSKSIGICFIGNYDIDKVPKDMWAAGLRLVNWLQRIYNISNLNVKGHKEFANKTCPGRNFDLDLFRSNLINICPD